MPITITNESIYGKPQPAEPARIQVSQPQPEVDPFLPAIEAVQKAGDSLTKEKALLDLTNQYGEFESQKMKQFHDMAYGRFGVSGLERQLKFSEQKDRSHPMWLQYQTDSEETARARAMYDKSLSLAEGHIRELASSDPDILKTKTRVGAFMKTQERLLNTMLQKEGIQNEKVDQITSILTPTNMEAVQALYPEVKDERELKLRAAQLLTNPQFREEAAVIMDPAAKPQDYLAAAVHGISKAVPYVVQKQAALTGQPTAEVENELTKMRALLLNSDALQKEADKFLSPIERQELGNLKQKSMLSKDKDSLAKMEALKVETAIKVMKASKKSSLLGNAASWQPVDGMRLIDLPEFDALRTAGKPINLNTIYEKFVYNAPKEARSSRAALVQQHLLKNAEKLNGTLYGEVVDLSTLKAKTQAMAIPGIFDNIAAGLSTVATMPNAYTIGPVF